MAQLVVKYISKDHLHSDETQYFFGVTLDECWNQREEFEEWLGREHHGWIGGVYDTEILEERETVFSEPIDIGL